MFTVCDTSMNVNYNFFNRDNVHPPVLTIIKHKIKTSLLWSLLILIRKCNVLYFVV